MFSRHGISFCDTVHIGSRFVRHSLNPPDHVYGCSFLMTVLQWPDSYFPPSRSQVSLYQHLTNPQTNTNTKLDTHKNSQHFHPQLSSPNALRSMVRSNRRPPERSPLPLPHPRRLPHLQTHHHILLHPMGSPTRILPRTPIRNQNSTHPTRQRMSMLSRRAVHDGISIRLFGL